MKIRFDGSGSLNALKKIIEELDHDPEVQGILCCTCDANDLPEQPFSSILMACETPLFGGIVPGLIFESKQYTKGILALGFASRTFVQVVHDIHLDPEAIEDELELLGDHLSSGKTFLLALDGLSSGVEAFKEALFYTLGLSKNYIGGGAGSLSFERKPRVITNEGLLMDAAVVALIDIKSGVGVAHGWETVSEPLKVTESEGNRILSINWAPAYEAYRNQIKQLFGVDISEKNFFDVAKSHPFGIAKLGSEMVVRDPISADGEDAIVCVGGIPESTIVHLLSGDAASLIEGAKQAKNLSELSFLKAYGRFPNGHHKLLVVDCISRALFLGDDYQKELDVFGKEGVVGILSVGELANAGKAYLELYNKTSVVAVLEE